MTVRILFYFFCICCLTSISYAQEVQTFPLSRIDSSNIADNDLQIMQLKEEKEWKEATRFMNKNGLIYWEHNYLDKAIECYRESLDINVDLGNSNAISMINNNMGMIYADLYEYKKALDCFEKTFVARKYQKAKIGMISALINQSVVLNNLKRYDTSEIKLEEAVVIARETNNPEQLRLCYGMLAETLTKKGDAKGAFYYFNLYKTFYEFVEKKKVEKFEENAEQAEAKLKIAELEKENQSLQLQVKSKKIEEQNEIISIKESNVNALKQKMSRAELLIENQNQELKITELLKKEVSDQERIIQHRSYITYSIAIILFLITIALFIQYKASSKDKIANTKLRLLNNEIGKKNEELNKLMIFKNSLNNMLMHDLKVPLTVIENNILHINNAGHRKAAQSANQQMTRVVQNILDIELYQETELPINKKIIDLNQMIWSVVHTATYLAEKKNIDIIFGSTKQYQVNCDDAVISRVFMNILSNSIKYSPVNSNIEITVEEIDTEVKIQIHDNGPGIEAKNHKSIFMLYENSNPENIGVFKSSGIGLAFCKLAIESHKGTIGVISNNNKGTTFWFRIEGEQRKIQVQNETKSIDNNHKELTDNEITQLLSFCRQIEKYEVFEISEIQKIIDSIELNSHAVNHWKEKLNNTLLHFNEEEFHKLLNLKSNNNITV